MIEAARGCAGILLQYAPITAGVVAALPELGIVSRIGAGFDTVDVEACKAHGVWVANSPDYGVGEVATHALALALASLRNVVRYHDDIRADRWHYLSSGTLRRPAELTLGIVGLGRIGKRMAHVSRNVFKRVVAFDPLLIDGDFPAYVERARRLDGAGGRGGRRVAAHAARRDDARHDRRRILRGGEAGTDARQHVARRRRRHRPFARGARCWNTAGRRAGRAARGAGAARFEAARPIRVSS